MTHLPGIARVLKVPLEGGINDGCCGVVQHDVFKKLATNSVGNKERGNECARTACGTATKCDKAIKEQ